jgi:hypothetical protein
MPVAKRKLAPPGILIGSLAQVRSGGGSVVTSTLQSVRRSRKRARARITGPGLGTISGWKSRKAVAQEGGSFGASLMGLPRVASGTCTFRTMRSPSRRLLRLGREGLGGGRYREHGPPLASDDARRDEQRRGIARRLVALPDEVDRRRLAAGGAVGMAALTEQRQGRSDEATRQLRGERAEGSAHHSGSWDRVRFPRPSRPCRSDSQATLPGSGAAPMSRRITAVVRMEAGGYHRSGRRVNSKTTAATSPPTGGRASFRRSSRRREPR